MAIIGSGPAGFYTALRLLPKVKVDLFEQHVFPFGLVRYGVAPDHPEVKNCEERFFEVAASPHFKYYGNVRIGSDISIKKISESYNAVVLAYGAEKARTLNLPGNHDSKRIWSARDFVGWYNGEPEYQNLDFPLEKSERATIVGNGNVALDVARVLLKDPERFEATDITSKALEKLRQSTIRHVDIVGRRGLYQAAFTTKEIRELLKEPDVALINDTSEWSDLQPKERQLKRKLDVLRKGSSTAQEDAKKTWKLSFWRAPVGLSGNTMEWAVTRLNGDAIEVTDERQVTHADIVFGSIGYLSSPLSDLEALGIEWDQKKQVLSATQGSHVGGNVWAAGWVRTGPVGVIMTTMMDAFSTADEILESLTGPEKPGVKPEGTVVSWTDWLKINEEEKKRGSKVGKLREKFNSGKEALAFLNSH